MVNGVGIGGDGGRSDKDWRLEIRGVVDGDGDVESKREEENDRTDRSRAVRGGCGAVAKKFGGPGDGTEIVDVGAVRLAMRSACSR